MSIASMTGFARVNGNLQTDNENINWIWEIKSVNGKNLDIKFRLPSEYDDMAFDLRARATKYLCRGNVSVCLDVATETMTKKLKIDESLLANLTEKAIALSEKYKDKLAKPSAAELLAQKGVLELEECTLDEAEQQKIRQKMADDFEKLCGELCVARQKEGEKIKEALVKILHNIAEVTAKIEKLADGLPEKIKDKLKEMLAQYAKDVEISEDRLAQEIVFLVTKADIREEIDRLKAHIKSAEQLLTAEEAVGRKLDFLCQELNREANTTCSKACDIAITNLGMELKALIEQFREQVQNIE